MVVSTKELQGVRQDNNAKTIKQFYEMNVQELAGPVYFVLTPRLFFASSCMHSLHIISMGQSHCLVCACATGTFLTTAFTRNPIDPQAAAHFCFSGGAMTSMHKVYCKYFPNLCSLVYSLF